MLQTKWMSMFIGVHFSPWLLFFLEFILRASYSITVDAALGQYQIFTDKN